MTAKTNDTNIAWPIGVRLHILAGHGVPDWLHSFAGFVTQIGRSRYKLRVPVDDDKERWIPASQLQASDPWERKRKTAYLRSVYE